MFNETVTAIVTKEWNQFQQVHNQGGRAPCQNDYYSFAVNRASQFATWSDDMRTSYISDLEEAERAGRNLLTEKYAYMMESTAPAEYANIKHLLPPVSDIKIAAINQIVNIQLKWQNEYVRLYPKVSHGSRPTTSAADGGGDTSFETYLRSELMTYSDRTLAFYLAHVIQLDADGRNMTIENLENTAKLYGFASLADMEKLSK